MGAGGWGGGGGEGEGVTNYTIIYSLHCNKRLLIFPSPAEMSVTKLSLVGSNLINPDQGEFV